MKDTLLDLLLINLTPRTLTIIQENIDCMTCVPLHPKRERFRGFNQSHLLAESLAKELRIPYTDSLLKRIKNTRPQAKLNRKKRLINMKNIFEVNANFHIKGLNILVFDDVATTLATLNENARIMKLSGANKVWGMSFARG